MKLYFTRIYEAEIPVRFCTNETQMTKKDIASKLNSLGFMMSESEIFPPAPAMSMILKEESLRPHLVVHPGN